MKIVKHLFPKHTVLLISILFLYCAVMLSTALNRLSFTEGTYVFAYQVLCMLLPGLASLRLIGYSTESSLEKVGIAYALGYSISILSYIIAIPFKTLIVNWMSLIPIFNYMFSLLSAVYLLIDKRRCTDNDMGSQTTREMIIFQCYFACYVYTLFSCFWHP